MSVGTIGNLLDLWGDRARLAADLGCGFETVEDWYREGRIPERFWVSVVASARKRGIPGISVRLIASLPSALGAEDFREIIDLWPSQLALATDLRLPPASVRGWRYRNTIPAKWWTPLLESASKHGIRDLDYAILSLVYMNKGNFAL
jgi:hypothetical protein